MIKDTNETNNKEAFYKAIEKKTVAELLKDSGYGVVFCDTSNIHDYPFRKVVVFDGEEECFLINTKFIKRLCENFDSYAIETFFKILSINGNLSIDYKEASENGLLNWWSICGMVNLAANGFLCAEDYPSGLALRLQDPYEDSKDSEK